MLKILSQNASALTVDNSEPNKVVDLIKEYIEQSDCKDITVDISNLSLIDACRVSVLSSTEHYLKYPECNINWIVSSSSVEKMASCMGLGNSSFIYK